MWCDAVTLLTRRPAECLWHAFVCTIAVQASGRAAAKSVEWKVELGCGIWPCRIGHCVLYLAIRCGARPRNHRKKTICSVHNEGYMVKGHSKQNWAKTFKTRLFYGSISAEEIKELARTASYNKISTLNFSFPLCDILAFCPTSVLCPPVLKVKSISYYPLSLISSLY